MLAKTFESYNQLYKYLYNNFMHSPMLKWILNSHWSMQEPIRRRISNYPMKNFEGFDILVILHPAFLILTSTLIFPVHTLLTV